MLVAVVASLLTCVGLAAVISGCSDREKTREITRQNEQSARGADSAESVMGQLRENWETVTSTRESETELLRRREVLAEQLVARDDEGLNALSCALDGEPNERGWILWALGRFEPSSLRRSVILKIRPPFGLMDACSLAGVMSQDLDPLFEPQVILISRDSEPQARVDALMLLFRLNTPSALERMKEMTSDSVQRVREAADEVLRLRTSEIPPHELEDSDD